MKKFKVVLLLALPIALGAYVNERASWKPRTLAQYPAPVLSVSWSPDRNRLASAGGDGNVSVWDTSTMKLQQMRVGWRSRKATAVAFSPDGQWLAGSFGASQSESGVGGQVALWEAKNITWQPRAWEERENAPNDDSPHMKIAMVGVAFSTDSSTIAASHDSTELSLWDVESGGAMQGIYTATQGSFYMKDIENSVGLALSPDGRAAICWDTDGAFSWFDTRKAVKKEYEGEPTNIKGNCATFSPDGKTLAVGTWGGVQLYSVQNRKLIGRSSRHNSDVSAVAFSPNSSTLASGGLDGRILLWDVASRQSLRALTGHTKPVTSLTFAPDGNTLASSSADGTIRLWRAH